MKVLNTYILCLLASVLTLSCSVTKNNEVSSNENNKFPPPPPPALADGYYGELTNYNHIKGWVNIVNFEDGGDFFKSSANITISLSDSIFFSTKSNSNGYYEFLKLDTLFNQSKPFNNEILKIRISLDSSDKFECSNEIYFEKQASISFPKTLNYKGESWSDIKKNVSNDTLNLFHEFYYHPCRDLKPIIYLYPEKIQEIEVQLDYDGELTHTYPKFSEGWKVTANPDGTLFDAKNQEYYALYWEGKPNKDYTINEGFLVPGEQTIDFLENTLSKLGLNRKEANEFIIYWLPKMENNPYNLIHFSSTEYEEMAKLNITPKPETLIRVMMVFKPLDNSIKIKKQNLNSMSKKRKGFTVVEWGGHPLPKTHSIDL